MHCLVLLKEATYYNEFRAQDPERFQHFTVVSLAEWLTIQMELILPLTLSDAQIVPVKDT